ncbi:unnamed protein product [Boreogadus saida]
MFSSQPSAVDPCTSDLTTGQQVDTDSTLNSATTPTVATIYYQSPSTKSLGTSYTPHCTDLGCSSMRHPLGVIAGESRLNGSLWG